MWPFSNNKLKLQSEYNLKYPENEIEVIEIIDGFILHRKYDDHYYVDYECERYDPFRRNGIELRWEPTRTGTGEDPYSADYIPERWWPHKFKTAAEAIDMAVTLEEMADNVKDEKLRRKNFIERRVWR